MTTRFDECQGRVRLALKAARACGAWHPARSNADRLGG
jgi:hypothetical protein